MLNHTKVKFGTLAAGVSFVSGHGHTFVKLVDGWSYGNADHKAGRAKLVKCAAASFGSMTAAQAEARGQVVVFPRNNYVYLPTAPVSTVDNQHAHLDKQNAEHSLAIVTPEEHAEYCAWLDMVNN